MLESVFLTVNEWIAGGTAIAALGCFLWGMISVVFSPCHLASIPLIVAYVGGQQQLLKPREAGFYSVAFTSGLFITIALVGIICAFGFIAPILAIITVQKQIATGILFILLFAIGHCLPIVVAGSSTAAVKKVMENSTWQGAGNWFRKGAGVVIVMLGAYFIINPFFTPS